MRGEKLELEDLRASHTGWSLMVVYHVSARYFSSLSLFLLGCSVSVQILPIQQVSYLRVLPIMKDKACHSTKTFKGVFQERETVRARETLPLSELHTSMQGAAVHLRAKTSRRAGECGWYAKDNSNREFH